MSSREQKLEAALREIADLAVPSRSERLNAIRRLSRRALIGENADEHEACAQWRSWHEGSCDEWERRRAVLGEQEATPPEPCAKCGGTGNDHPYAPAVFHACPNGCASAPQGEAEPPDNKHTDRVAEVIRTALRAAYHDNGDGFEGDPHRFGVSWPDGDFTEVRVYSTRPAPQGEGNTDE